MDFSKIKLVVTDMDGTLLNDNHEVSPRFLEQFEKLKELNIEFVAASGRQYYSIIDKLQSIKDDISVIAENGAMMKFEDKIDVLLQLSTTDIEECIKTIRNIEGSYIVLCARKTAYIESKDDTFYKTLKQYYAEVKKVDDLTSIENDEFLKIAIYHYDSTEKYVLPEVEQFNDDFQVIVSGQNWLDISHKNANKAYALAMIQKKLGYDKAETMVFGDYNNDLGMLELSELSFAMKNSHPNVKNIANYQTKSNNEDGVEHILEQLIISRT